MLNEIIEEVNLTDDEIDELLMQNNEDNEVFTEKILKTLEKYKDNTTSTIARIIGKHCKRREIRRKITLNQLENEDIITKMQTEQRI